MLSPGGVVQATGEALEPMRMLELAFVAKRYYVDGRSKVEIADETGISRFRVARLLDDAVASGVVRIEINAPNQINPALSLALKDHFGLERAVVAETTDHSEDSARGAVAGVAAALLGETLTPKDIVGIGWGRTIHDLVSQLPPLPPCSAVQIVGGMPDVELWMNSVDLVRRFADVTGGPMHTFLLPYLVKDDTVGKGLQTDAAFTRVRELFSSLSVVIAAVGAWDPPRSGLYELLTESERKAIRRKGVVADMFGTLLNADGEIVPSGLEARSVGITPDELQAVPSVIAVASGIEKAAAISAALRSGLVTSIVTDSLVAAELLAGRPAN